eukprot:4683809-Amphidinium_carterae.2
MVGLSSAGSEYTLTKEVYVALWLQSHLADRKLQADITPRTDPPSARGENNPPPVGMEQARISVTMKCPCTYW